MVCADSAEVYPQRKIGWDSTNDLCTRIYAVLVLLSCIRTDVLGMVYVFNAVGIMVVCSYFYRGEIHYLSPSAATC